MKFNIDRLLFLKNCTPPKRKPYVCISLAFKNSSFFASTSIPNRSFFATLLQTSFFRFSKSKNTFFLSNMEPNLGVKNFNFFYKIGVGNPPALEDLPRHPNTSSRTPPGFLAGSPGPLQNASIASLVNPISQNLHLFWNSDSTIKPLNIQNAHSTLHSITRLLHSDFLPAKLLPQDRHPSPECPTMFQKCRGQRCSPRGRLR